MLSTRRVGPLPRGLYAVCDDTVRPEVSLPQKAAWLLEGGAEVLQLRLKRTPLREAVPLARRLALDARARGAKLVINDRVDLALLAAADGVHLGADDLPIRDARALLGPEALVGATVRSLEDAQRARDDGADYAGIGPVFSTRTKAVDAPALGLEALAEIAPRSPLPLVAISGITLENIAQVARTGVRCAAVISDALAAQDVPGRVRALNAAFLSAGADAGSCAGGDEVGTSR